MRERMNLKNIKTEASKVGGSKLDQQKYEIDNCHYCPNCKKINGKTRIDCFGVRVCAEKVKGDNYKYGCASSVKEERLNNYEL